MTLTGGTTAMIERTPYISAAVSPQWVNGQRSVGCSV